MEVAKTEKVHLILNGVNIASAKSAAMHIKSADKTTITLAEGTTNSLTDAAAYVYELPGQTKPNACLYSTDDVTINGKGKLVVNGNYNNGIGTKNDLKIVNGDITVSSIKNALKGVDSISIKGGTINLTAQNDGMKSDNELEENRGVINIFGGTISITAGDDSIQAYTKVNISAGKVTVQSVGKDINCPIENNIKVADGCLISNSN